MFSWICSSCVPYSQVGRAIDALIFLGIPLNTSKTTHGSLKNPDTSTVVKAMSKAVNLTSQK